MDRQFIIRTQRIGTPRWWKVHIHPTVKALQEAAYRHRPHGGRGYWDGCEGCCHPVDWLENDDRPGSRIYPANGYAGLLRYAEPSLTTEIVAHELVHAAVATYRMNARPDVRLGTQCNGREEALAYIMGELFASLDAQL